MKVRFLQGIAGNDFSHTPKEECEIENKLAAMWIESGVCEAITHKRQKAVIKRRRKAIAE